MSEISTPLTCAPGSFGPIDSFLDTFFPIHQNNSGLEKPWGYTFADDRDSYCNATLLDLPPPVYCLNSEGLAAIDASPLRTLRSNLEALQHVRQ